MGVVWPIEYWYNSAVMTTLWLKYHFFFGALRNQVQSTILLHSIW